MCPPGGNIIRFPPMFGEFVIPTMGKHTDPSPQQKGETERPAIFHNDWALFR